MREIKIDEMILDLLKGSGQDFLSGEEIAAKAGLTRTAVWKRITHLRDIGYKIEGETRMGYRLLGIPDRLIPDEIKRGLGTKSLGKEIYSYQKVDSTNDIAYQLAEHGKEEGVIVISEEQQKGRGRLGRIWESPPNCGLYLSCILRPDIEPKEVSKITLAAAVGAAKSIKESYGLEPSIKWPNDILIQGKKVCGILTELKAELDKVDFVILGVGVNINTPLKLLPGSATSIKEVLKKDVSRIEFTRTLIRSLEAAYTVFKEKGFEPLRREFKGLSSTLGRYVKVTSHHKTLEGLAADVDEDGALVVEVGHGRSRRILSGDVDEVR